MGPIVSSVSEGMVSVISTMVSVISVVAEVTGTVSAGSLVEQLHKIRDEESAVATTAFKYLYFINTFKKKMQ